MIAMCLGLLAILVILRRRRKRQVELFQHRADMYAQGLAQAGVVSNVTFEDPREQRRQMLRDFNELGTAEPIKPIQEDATDDDLVAGVNMRYAKPALRPQNGLSRSDNRRSSVYEDTVVQSLSKLEHDLIQVSRDEWMLNNPGQNPDTSPHWQSLEEQLRRDFSEKFRVAADKRRTFHEEENLDGFASIPGYNENTPTESDHDDDEYTPMDTLEKALEDALAEAEIKARSADEKARALEQMAAKARAGPDAPEKPSISLNMDTSMNGDDGGDGYIGVEGVEETSPDTEW